jgi:hypothetical protein
MTRRIAGREGLLDKGDSWTMQGMGQSGQNNIEHVIIIDKLQQDRGVVCFGSLHVQLS